MNFKILLMSDIKSGTALILNRIDDMPNIDNSHHFGSNFEYSSVVAKVAAASESSSKAVVVGELVFFFFFIKLSFCLNRKSIATGAIPQSNITG